MLTLFQPFRNIGRHRAMILAMAMRELQARYIDTMGGMFWTIVHPLAVTAVYYVVFAVGFKARVPGDAPYILWFVGGLVPWFFFAEALPAVTNSLVQNGHLIKKTIFPVEILPIVHVVSSLVPHAAFMLILLCLMVFFDVPFDIRRLGVLYFVFCNCALLLGVGWLLSALQVFYRDIAQGLSIVLNVLFWATPIVWSMSIMPTPYRDVLAYNPILYIVDGYRGTLIHGTVLWPSLTATAYFWAVTAAVFLIGGYVFRRLRPEFADVM